MSNMLIHLMYFVLFLFNLSTFFLCFFMFFTFMPIKREKVFNPKKVLNIFKVFLICYWHNKKKEKKNKNVNKYADIESFFLLLLTFWCCNNLLVWKLMFFVWYNSRQIKITMLNNIKDLAWV